MTTSLLFYRYSLKPSINMFSIGFNFSLFCWKWKTSIDLGDKFCTATWSIYLCIAFICIQKNWTIMKQCWDSSTLWSDWLGNFSTLDCSSIQLALEDHKSFINWLILPIRINKSNYHKGKNVFLSYSNIFSASCNHRIKK